MASLWTRHQRLWQLARECGLATDRTDEVGDLSRALGAWQATAKDRDRVFNLSADMFAVAGFDGVFKTINPSWQRVTGWTPAELTSKPYVEFVHPDDRAATIAEGNKIAAGAETLAFRNRYQCQDGSYRWFDWTAVPVMEESLIFAVARDITEQQNADDAIKALNKELEAFTYSVSHDLRAPLRAIHGFVGILLEDYGAELQGEARRYLDLVAANVEVDLLLSEGERMATLPEAQVGHAGDRHGDVVDGAVRVR